MSNRTAITIGNFDGVHRGHSALVRAARQAVGDGRVVAMVFDPHPSVILRPEAVPARLSTLEQRTRWLIEAGADLVVGLRPTAAFLDQTPEQFVTQLGKGDHEFVPDFIVEGSDFRFGKGRIGTVQTLREMEHKFGFKTIVVPPVEAVLSDQSVVQVSSSMVRRLSERGRVRDAGFLLGRPYELNGTVVRGDQRGRTLAMPTINLGPTDMLLPADGIYAGRANGPQGEGYPAAISIGTKPTFGENPRTCEAHLIGYTGPLDDYGWTTRIEFHDWQRDQVVFADVESLVEQLKRDVERVGRAVGAEWSGNWDAHRAQTSTMTSHS